MSESLIPTGSDSLTGSARHFGVPPIIVIRTVKITLGLSSHSTATKQKRAVCRCLSAFTVLLQGVYFYPEQPSQWTHTECVCSHEPLKSVFEAWRDYANEKLATGSLSGDVNFEEPYTAEF